jgi:hypothetical protein
MAKRTIRIKNWSAGALSSSASEGAAKLLAGLVWSGNSCPWRNDHQDWRVVGHRRKLRGEAMIDNRIQVFDVAMKNARTIEACVDRLVMMGADHELKLVAQRLSRLTFRLRHQPSKVRKGWEQSQSSAA